MKWNNLIKAFSSVPERFDHVENIQYSFLLASFGNKKKRETIALEDISLTHQLCLSRGVFVLPRGARPFQVFPFYFPIHFALNFMNVLFRHLCRSKLFSFLITLCGHGRRKWILRNGCEMVQILNTCW